MSRNTPLISAVGLLSNVACISCLIDSRWAINESPGGKSDCEEVLL